MILTEQGLGATGIHGLPSPANLSIGCVLHQDAAPQGYRSEGRTPGCRGILDYQKFTRHGIFAELGEGDIDFAAIISVMKDVGFEAWLIV